MSRLARRIRERIHLALCDRCADGLAVWLPEFGQHVPVRRVSARIWAGLLH